MDEKSKRNKTAVKKVLKNALIKPKKWHKYNSHEVINDIN